MQRTRRHPERVARETSHTLHQQEPRSLNRPEDDQVVLLDCPGRRPLCSKNVVTHQQRWFVGWTRNAERLDNPTPKHEPDRTLPADPHYQHHKDVEPPTVIPAKLVRRLRATGHQCSMWRHTDEPGKHDRHRAPHVERGP